ncbi:hypothetical protein SARC_10535 [Sphaeroforma arctica JP610]|uniref:50S ribosomal protein L22 n=1 Tax=Sphaeroforma arctica JP610 TaxID=667725 RepID=A0A0L0FJN8_9EUKA|nr:hypothetical protein SARC_10535 [Sphaeroforma arctica JP610]KNC76994.1 hypothetical protein SARC_10535 [Sphaeroforma arctica JP610]|eukprot:XP_014150896.1 hypothetical protein SARC_10535 [Sphaeroforma arctica JP610]
MFAGWRKLVGAVHTNRPIQRCLLHSGKLRCTLSPQITQLIRGKVKEVESEKQIGKRRNLDGSPWKLNLVAKQIRGLPVLDAINQMTFSGKKASQDVKSVLYNTMQAANHNKGLEAKNLIVSQCHVGKGTYRRKLRYQGKGSMSLMQIKHSHLYVELKEGEQKKKRETRMMRRLKKHENARKPKKIRSALM